jgi:hypothetical protein
MHKEATIKQKGTQRDDKLAEGCKYVAKGSEAEPKGSQKERNGSQKESKGSQKGARSEGKICPKIDLRKSRRKDAPREPLKPRQGPKYAQKCGFGGPFRAILETFSTKYPSPSAYEKHCIFTCFLVFWEVNGSKNR